MSLVGKKRVNLSIHALEDGRAVYHTVHIGFFPHKVAETVALSVDARGLAFNSRYAGQTGRVDVVTCDMGNFRGIELTVRSEEYEPRSFDVLELQRAWLVTEA